MEGVSEEQEGKHPEGVDVAPGREERRADEDNNAANAAANTEGAGSGAGDEQAPAADEGSTQTEGEGESELEHAQREIAELKDHWNRERADFANFRKRTIVERQKAEGEAVARFTRELLNVLDNLDRVLSMKSDNPEVSNFLTGVQMIRENFIQVLGNHRIRTVNPEGEPFDPSSMEAIAKEDRDDLERDTVLEVYQAGYVIEFSGGDSQVLRAARVKVGVKANKQTTPTADEAPATDNNAEES